MEKETRQNIESIIEAGKMNELRKLLTGLNHEELERLQKLLNDPHEFSNEISSLLPYAIRKMVERGEISVDSLLPFVEESMHKSIQKNPQKLADILFPVMGPAIRKAVSEDLKRMIASINASLESGFSARSLKWRLQAFSSRRSYAEIVLANSYLYHVSNVFLIHKDSGILLHEASAPESKALEADLIASMLTAIRDFVQDSFSNAEKGTLDEIQFGSLKILIEQGPYAVLAVVAEGQPPADYRVTLMETIEAIHFNLGLELEKFDGNTEYFKHADKFLQQCLIKQKKEKKHKAPYQLIFLLLLLAAGAGYLGVRNYQNKTAFKRFISELETTPGYHISNSRLSYNKIYLKGLVDPLAEPVEKILKRFQNIKPEALEASFEGYLSTEPEILLRRAGLLLSPPEGVEMKIENNRLFISGTATADWEKDLELKIAAIAGITGFDISGLNKKITDLQWIIPSIERHRFLFDINVVKLDSLQQIQFDSLVQAAVFLDTYNQLYNRNMAIYVRSYTNRNGNVAANERVAIARAESFMTLLENAGVKKALLKSQVLFAEDLRESVSLRSVHFSVFDNKPISR